jgi:hypothetical protein
MVEALRTMGRSCAAAVRATAQDASKAAQAQVNTRKDFSM